MAACRATTRSQGLIDQGLLSVSHVEEIRELNPTVGGPIIKDRLWFYGGLPRPGVAEIHRGHLLQQRIRSTRRSCSRRQADVLYPRRPRPRFARSDEPGLQRRPLSPVVHAATSPRRCRRRTRSISSTTWDSGTPTTTPSPTHVAGGGVVPVVRSRLPGAGVVDQSGDTASCCSKAGGTFFNETWRWLQQRDSRHHQRLWSGCDRAEGRVVDFYVRTAPTTATPAPVRSTISRTFALASTTSPAVTPSRWACSNMWGTRNYRFETNGAQLWTFLRGEPSSITQFARPLEDLQKLKSALGSVSPRIAGRFADVTLQPGLAVRLPQRLRPGAGHPGASIRRPQVV